MVKSPFPWQDSTRFRLSRKTDVNAEDPSEGDEAMKVGFIGLGTMGASMASNLQAGGHELQVSDVRKEAAALHLKAGAIWKDTPRQVAEAWRRSSPRCPVPRKWSRSPSAPRV